MSIVKRVNPEFQHKKTFFSLILYLCEVMDVHQTCGNHFMMPVNQIIMLYNKFI